MRKWFEMRAGADGGVAEISIYGSIGKSFWDDDSVGAADFAQGLKALGDVSGITLRINSPGGDVFDGVAIYNLLQQHPAKVTARVDGLAASAASFIAMAADEIIMPSNAFMLVHEPSGGAWGTADTMMAMAADLERMTETFAATYAKRTGMSVEDVKSLMKEDRLIDATEANSKGLCDVVDEPVMMAATYSLGCLPDNAREAFRAAMTTVDAPTIVNAPAAIDDGETTDDSAIVVNIEDARAQSRDGAFAEAAEIAELCGLAGLPELAAGFIASRSAVSDVRTALVEAKAKKSEQTSMIAVRAEAVKAEATSLWSKAIAKQNSRVR